MTICLPSPLTYALGDHTKIENQYASDVALDVLGRSVRVEHLRDEPTMVLLVSILTEYGHDLQNPTRA